MSTAGQSLDASGRAVLAEDLRSPCTEEIAVFRAFARTVAQGQDAFVVLDTAPTGHTLLLLDATEAYHREIARKASNLPDEVLQLLPRLRDGRFTRVLIVTLPEATPVHEAGALQSDLRRAGIEPFAWVINQSFAQSGTRDPLLMARGRGENPFIREVVEELSKRTTLVPWVAEEPVGPEKLRQLLHNPQLQPASSMTTSVYETIPQKAGEKPRYHEIKPSMSDAPLSEHPETGEPIRRLVLGGFGTLSSKRGQSSCGCGPEGCCG